MGVVSIDASPTTYAIKLTEHSRISTDKLMELISSVDSMSFSQNGILRGVVENGAIIRSVQTVLEGIKA
jgi:hypothetical protein